MDTKKKTQEVGLWLLQISAAAIFAMTGYLKLSGAEMPVHLFDAIGFGQWFRYFTGGLELTGAILLLIPALSGVASALMIPVMIGAIGAHLFVVGGSPAIPIALLFSMAVVTFGRKERTLKLFGLAKP